MPRYIENPSSEEYYTDSSTDEETEQESLPRIVREIDDFENDSDTPESLEPASSHVYDEEFSDGSDEETMINRVSVESDDELLHRQLIPEDELEEIEETVAIVEPEETVDDDDYSSEEEAPLNHQCLEVLDDINYSKGLSKSTFVTGTCGYTLNENVKCIQCHVCNDCYSIEGILENHRTGHLPGEPLKCPTCKTPIEISLLLPSIDKDTLLEITKQQWKETMNKPIFMEYVNTVRILHEAGLTFSDHDRTSPKKSIIKLLYEVKEICESKPVRPVKTNCPNKLRRLIVLTCQRMFEYSSIDDLRDGSKVVSNVLNNSFPMAFSWIERVISVARNSSRIDPEDVQTIEDLYRQWRSELNSTIYHPHELIGMVYQQITELGEITDSLIDFIKTNAYVIFKRYELPVTKLLDAIIDAMVPGATEINKRFIREILNSYDHVALNTLPIDLSMYAVCPMRFIQSFDNSSDNVCSCGGPIIEGTCTLCGELYCSKCMHKKTHDHTCNKDDLETIKTLNKTTVRCPKCTTRIQKSYGCDHMFCTQCRCNFDWVSGQVINESEQTNSLYSESLSALEKEYSYYIQTMMRDIDDLYDTPYLPINDGLIIYALAMEKLGYESGLITDELGRALSFNLRNTLNRETAESFKGFIAKTIDSTMKTLKGIINESEAEMIAERIAGQCNRMLRFAITNADALI